MLSTWVSSHWGKLFPNFPFSLCEKYYNKTSILLLETDGSYCKIVCIIIDIIFTLEYIHGERSSMQSVCFSLFVAFLHSQWS